MNLSPLVKKSLYFAAQKHDGQYRKGNHVPYITHPVQVAFSVSSYTNNEEIIAAAFIHDVLEDCDNVSLSFLKKEFGDKVAKLVNEVSFVKNKKYSTWKDKRKKQLLKIKRASKDALLIIAVDKMVNFQSYFDALKKKGAKIQRDFGGTPDEYRWFYTEIENILKFVLGNHPIAKDYTLLWKLYKK